MGVHKAAQASANLAQVQATKHQKRAALTQEQHAMYQGQLLYDLLLAQQETNRLLAALLAK